MPPATSPNLSLASCDLNHCDPTVDRFMLLCTRSNLHQNRFIRFQNIVFTNLVTDEQDKRNLVVRSRFTHSLMMTILMPPLGCCICAPATDRLAAGRCPTSCNQQGWGRDSSSSSRMRVMNHNWSDTKQRLHPQSVVEISRHSVLSGDRIRQCETSSGSRHNDTDQCL